MEDVVDFSFPSEERLKHKKLFEQLFSGGNRVFKHPVLAMWSVTDLPEESRIQAGFVAPKKHYKNATDRNRIKRWLREAYRTQKHDLDQVLKSEGKHVAILFITVKTDNISYEDIRPKILLLLREIASNLHAK